MVNMLMDALLLSLHRLTYGLSKVSIVKKWLSVITHTRQRRDPLCPSFNTVVCSSFMAAVVRGRHTTSGHLTSLGIGVGVGVGAGSLKAELFFLGFFYSRHQWRRMEELTAEQAEFASPYLLCLLQLLCPTRRRGSGRFLSQEAQSSCEKQGLMGNLLSGVKEGC